MALLGNAAMLLWFDTVGEAIAELDDWLTREHIAERVAIPGFICAQRWVAQTLGPRNFIVYEVADLDVLSSAAYRERLDHPTPWTARMMPHFRGMARGFMNFQRRHGQILGTSALVVRFSAAPAREQQLQDWLDGDLIPDALGRQGVTSAHVLASGRAPEMTVEQSIRGSDARVDRVLLLTGYNAACLHELSATRAAAASLEAHGASAQVQSDVYALGCITDKARLGIVA